MDLASGWVWHNVAESSILMHESILLFFAQSLLSWQHDTTFFWLPRLYSLKASFETIRKVTEAKPGKSRYDKELDDGWCGDCKKWSYDHAALTLSSKEITTKWCLEDATLQSETLRFYREVITAIKSIAWAPDISRRSSSGTCPSVPSWSNILLQPVHAAKLQRCLMCKATEAQADGYSSWVRKSPRGM